MRDLIWQGHCAGASGGSEEQAVLGLRYLFTYIAYEADGSQQVLFVIFASPVAGCEAQVDYEFFLRKVCKILVWLGACGRVGSCSLGDGSEDKTQVRTCYFSQRLRLPTRVSHYILELESNLFIYCKLVLCRT